VILVLIDIIESIRLSYICKCPFDEQMDVINVGGVVLGVEQMNLVDKYDFD